MSIRIVSHALGLRRFQTVWKPNVSTDGFNSLFSGLVAIITNDGRHLQE